MGIYTGYRPIDDTTIVKIDIYDFDGTLAKSIHPDEGHDMYRRKTGRDWPFRGWWGRRESMLYPLEPVLVPEIVADFNESIKTPGTLVVLMTGRPSHCGDIIQAILTDNDLYPDAYFFNPGTASTLDWKTSEIANLIARFPLVEEVEIWEDRKNHAKAFSQLGDVHPNVLFKVNKVDNGKDE